MKGIKRLFKRNTHNVLFKNLASFGRSMNRLYENRNHDIYCNGELAVIRKISRFKPIVLLDGGANIGNYSLILNELNPNSTIYAFEPVTSTYNQLKDSVEKYSNIIPVNKGLYSEDGTSEIKIFNSHTHSSLYNRDGFSYQAKEVQTINLVRGDNFLKEYTIPRIDFMKLDLEGAEYEALKGFEESLRNKNIRVVQFEYGYMSISTKKLLIDYYELFYRYGYIVGKIFPKKVEFRDYELKHENFLGSNFIAVDRKDSELISCLKNR